MHTIPTSILPVFRTLETQAARSSAAGDGEASAAFEDVALGRWYSSARREGRGGGGVKNLPFVLPAGQCCLDVDDVNIFIVLLTGCTGHDVARNSWIFRKND